MTCAEHLLIVDRAYAARTGARVEFLERAMPCPTELYLKAMRMMRGRPFDDCDEALKGLVFLQEVAATALWRHRCPVGDTLASFAREFDRLDVPAEHERLYVRAQTP